MVIQILDVNNATDLFSGIDIILNIRGITPTTFRGFMPEGGILCQKPWVNYFKT